MTTVRPADTHDESVPGRQQFAGNPAHPDHDRWLLELGRVTREAARLTTICFDLARMVGGVDAEPLFSDPLGGLEMRLRELDCSESQPMKDFLAALDTARRTRNDVTHALLVTDGLLRRNTQRRYDRGFSTVESLSEAATELRFAARIGIALLDANGGDVIDAWRQHDN